MNELLWRHRLSGVMAFIAFTALLAAVSFIAYMWIYAWQHNLYPKVPIAQDAYRPAWYYVVALEEASKRAFGLSVSAVGTAALSWVFKRNRLAVIIGWLGIASGFAAIIHILILIAD